MENVNAVPDEQALYEALYREHYARVLRLCHLWLEDPCEAADVAQDVFLKLFQAYQRETRTIAWGPWLTRVTLNACRDRRRSRWWKWWRAASRVPSPETLQALDRPSHLPTPEQEALSREACRQIWAAFRGLPRRQQEVFVLRYLEGWSTDAVAEMLGLTAGSVKRHLFRATQRLRATIGGDV